MNTTTPPHAAAAAATADTSARWLRDPSASLTLPAGRCLRLEPARSHPGQSLCLRVEAGAVWVTWAGCGDDVFVQAGHSLRLPVNAQALLVETEPRLALGAARLRLLPGPPRPGRWAAGWGWQRAQV